MHQWQCTYTVILLCCNTCKLSSILYVRLFGAVIGKKQLKKLAKQRGCLFGTINSQFYTMCMYIKRKNNIIGLCHVNIYDYQNKLLLCNFRFADRGQLRNIIGKLVSAHPKLRSRLPMQSKR